MCFDEAAFQIVLLRSSFELRRIRIVLQVGTLLLRVMKDSFKSMKPLGPLLLFPNATLQWNESEATANYMSNGFKLGSIYFAITYVVTNVYDIMMNLSISDIFSSTFQHLVGEFQYDSGPSDP